MQKTDFRAGVISDTHSLIRPEALDALRGVDQILHAGDIGSPGVLDALRNIAPLAAIRGNIDRDPWSRELPSTAAVELCGVWIYMVHNLRELDLDPGAAGFAAVISGHTHRPLSEWRDGILYLNPGAAGPRRLHLPVCIGLLHISKGAISADIIELVL